MCILVNYLKSFFWNTQEHNKSISTSCVCKYGTLFFPEQFSHPLELWILTQLCKRSQADPITPFYEQGSWGISKHEVAYRRGQTHPSIYLEDYLWRRRQEHETNSPLDVFLLVDVDWQGGSQGWGHQLERTQIGVTTGFRDSSRTHICVAISACHLSFLTTLTGHMGGWHVIKLGSQSQNHTLIVSEARTWAGPTGDLHWDV